MVPLVARVVARRRQTRDTWTVTLDHDAGGVLARPLPGQFSMLYAFGLGEAPISVTATRRGRACSSTRSAPSDR